MFDERFSESAIPVLVLGLYWPGKVLLFSEVLPVERPAPGINRPSIFGGFAMNNCKLEIRLGLLGPALSFLLACSMTLNAGEVGSGMVPDGENRYGTSSTTTKVIQAFAFQPFSGDSANVNSNSFGARYCTTGCTLVAPVMLPAGASIEEIELESCDDDAAAEIELQLLRLGSLESNFEFLSLGSTGDASTPGCSFMVQDLGSPHTVDNQNNTYAVQIVLTGGTIDTRFQAVRVVYRLQISPPPGTATFGDVPTGHPFFQHVEALAASGITAGCGGGDFCPGDPLTRGQMAVFLAKALGLHWAN